MDISNSTGDSTGYRVMGSGGAQPCPDPQEAGGQKIPKVLHADTLEPNTYITVPVSNVYAICQVEFLPKGKRRPITLEIKGKGYENVLVALVSNGKSGPKAILHHKKA